MHHLNLIKSVGVATIVVGGTLGVSAYMQSGGYNLYSQIIMTIVISASRRVRSQSVKQL